MNMNVNAASSANPAAQGTESTQRSASAGDTQKFDDAAQSQSQGGKSELLQQILPLLLKLITALLEQIQGQSKGGEQASSGQGNSDQNDSACNCDSKKHGSKDSSADTAGN